MALSATNLLLKYPNPPSSFYSKSNLSFSLTLKTTTTTITTPLPPRNGLCCFAKAAAGKPHGGGGSSVKKRSNPKNTNKKKKNNPSHRTNIPTPTTITSNTKSAALAVVDVENYYDDDDDDGDDDFADEDDFEVASERYQALPLPKPPAGFVVDDHGRVLSASGNRIATIVDSTSNLPLECIIRRVFRSSAGEECMLLCPLDMPVLIVKSTNIEGWSAISDDEVEALLPNAAYALAKVHMHLIHSGFCYTARGGFCYTEDDIFEIRTEEGQDMDGVPTEGIEITCFHMDGSHYMIYTPSTPLLFVSVKDKNGTLQIADDELLEDPAIISAIDEETEFNALVEEEVALLESLLGER